MKRHRTLKVGILVVVAALLTAGAVAAGYLVVTIRPFVEAMEQGWLGPPDQRQRIELPDDGLAISFADDWTVRRPAIGPGTADWTADRNMDLTGDWRLARPLLVSTGPQEAPVCTLYVLPGAAAVPAPQVLGSWARAQGIPEDSSTMTMKTPRGATGIAYGDDRWASGAWLVARGDDAIVLTCRVRPATEAPTGDTRRPGDRLPMPWVMQPIVESIEVLGPPSA